MMRRVILGILALLLAACAGGRGAGEVAYYDLDTAREVNAPVAALRSIEVVGPSWLDSGSLQYRLSFDDGARRHAYGRSRWAAAPAEMLEQFLKRSLLGDSTAGRCRLRLELEEFLQVFDSTSASRGVIEARASLYVGQGRDPLARQSFSIARPALSADAQGGITALVAVSVDLSHGLRDWLQTLPPGQCQ